MSLDVSQRIGIESERLFEDVRQMIDEAHRELSSTVNATLTMLYWKVGERIQKEVLKKERGAYGRQIVVTLSRQLITNYGNGFSEKNIRSCHDN